MTTSLYRFRPLKYVASELKNSYLYFSTIDKLNDPMECFYRLFFKGEANLYSNLFKHFLVVMRLVSIDSTLNGKESFRKDIATKAFKIKKDDKIFKDIDEWVDENIATINLPQSAVWENEIKNILKELYERFYPQNSRHIEFKIAEYLEQLKKFAIKELLVCCFSKFEPTNERDCIDLSNDEILMWAHYANGYSGICLEFSDIMAQDRGFENDLEPKEIKYETIENYNVANISFPIGLVLSHIDYKYNFLSHPIVIEGLQDIYNQKYESIYHKKLDAWKYEREHRISISKNKLKNQKLAYKVECLKSITFGKRTPLDKQKQIINLIRNKNPNIAFYKVDIDENRGVLVRERMRDLD